MKPADHVIYGSIGAAALYPFMGQEAALFWLASILIDIDHYIDFLWHNRFTDFSFKRMFAYHGVLARRWHSPEFLNLEVFHTLEFLLPLLAAAHWLASPALFAVWLGFAYHVLLDMVYLSMNGVFFIRAYSFTEYFLRKRALENRGLRPVELYLEAVRDTKG